MEIKVTLSEAGIDRAIRELEKYERQVEDRCQKLVDRLVQMGIPVARANFSSAAYDGTNDVTVRSETDGTYTAIVAEGNAVLFIEFGTGVFYPDKHPEAAMLGMERGATDRAEARTGHGATMAIPVRTAKRSKRPTRAS